MMLRRLVLSLPLLAGCAWITDEEAARRLDGDGDGVPLDVDCDDADPALGAPGTWCADGDGDGWGWAEAATEACAIPSGFTADCTDCDDGDPDVHPGAQEACGGGDEDCDGETDEDGATGGATWYADGDGDGYGWASAATEACEAPSDFVADGTDCDDGDADVHPDGVEVCGGGDEDCDGETDEQGASGETTWYADDDDDGWGDDGNTAEACAAPSGHAAQGGDCDDSDPATFPGAPEDDCTDPHDYNCDGSSAWADADGDGWPACEECDDGEATTHPGAPEFCDGADNDCDGTTDEDPEDGATWYADADGDGYGDPASAVEACEAPAGHVADAEDCDDSDAGVHPGAAETPGAACVDGRDQDCDGQIDEDDAGCAACPEGCSAAACLWLDGVPQATLAAAPATMAAIDALRLGDGTYDDLLFAVDGAVLVAEDFAAGPGCFADGVAAGGALVASPTATCSFAAVDASAPWVLAVDVLAGSGDASLALLSGALPGVGWSGWAAAPVFEDGEGGAEPFAGGAPDPAGDHTVLVCGGW